MLMVGMYFDILKCKDLFDILQNFRSVYNVNPIIKLVPTRIHDQIILTIK